jgi:hypothetical protein
MSRARTNADNVAGDISGITASTGLSGGGTSGTVSVSIDTAITTDLSTAQTLTNKNLSSGTNTFPSSLVTLTGTQTLTNKTLTTPVISSISNTGTVTLPTSTDTLIGRTTTDTLTNKTLTDPKIDLAINAQTGTTYTFVLTDDCKLVTASNASAQTYTIPPASSVAYNIGSQLNILQKGAGQVTFAAGSGVTIRSNGASSAAPKLRAQYSSATAIYEGSDVWYVIGDIA